MITFGGQNVYEVTPKGGFATKTTSKRTTSALLLTDAVSSRRCLLFGGYYDGVCSRFVMSLLYSKLPLACSCFSSTKLFNNSSFYMF